MSIASLQTSGVSSILAYIIVYLYSYDSGHVNSGGILLATSCLYYVIVTSSDSLYNSGPRNE